MKTKYLLFSLKVFVPLLLLFLIACSGNTDQNTVKIYVSVEGDDLADGSIDCPLATLPVAVDKVRALRKSGNTDPVVIYLREGRHQLNQTLVLGIEDGYSSLAEPAKLGESGAGPTTGPAHLTFAAYPGENPVLSAGVPVTGWKLLESAPAELPSNATGKVWVADIPAGLERFYTLYDEHGRLNRARNAGFFPVKTGDRKTLYFPEGGLKNWENMKDIEIQIRPSRAWAINMLPLESVDEASGVATTGISATYEMGNLQEAVKNPLGASVWVENILEALDEPGEWVVNTQRGKIYLWPSDPAADGSPRGILAPGTSELIRVEGSIDYDGPVDTPVRGIAFSGLTFSHGERDVWTENDKGLQHEWDMYDKANAMIRFRGAENCAIENCHFARSGGSAIRVDLYGQDNRIVSNHIEHIGGTGVLLCGYGPGTKDVNKRNLVYNNHIHHTGEIYWHAPGIFIWQSGENRVANNLIHNTPYSSIIVSGYMDRFKSRIEIAEIVRSSSTVKEADNPPSLTCDNLIEYNEIHHAMEKLADGNGIYIRGAGNGNIIRRNYIHHLLAPIVQQSAIRTDGGQRGTLITENLIYKCVSTGIILKLNNRAENNIIADILPTTNNSKKIKASYFKLREGPLTGGAIQRNILYHPGNDVVFFEQGKNPRLPTAWAKEADTDFNLYYCAGNPELSKAALEEAQADGIDAHSLATDPLFVDPENGDFRLQPDSPALKLGFVPFDLSKAGLQDTH